MHSFRKSVSLKCDLFAALFVTDEQTAVVEASVKIEVHCWKVLSLKIRTNCSNGPNFGLNALCSPKKVYKFRKFNNVFNITRRERQIQGEFAFKGKHKAQTKTLCLTTIFFVVVHLYRPLIQEVLVDC